MVPFGSNRFGEGRKRRKVHGPQSIDSYLGRALEKAGVPSQRITKELGRAWVECAHPTWVSKARLIRIHGGMLEVGVQSSALRDELTNFHRPTLLQALRTAVPTIPLVGLRFVLEPYRTPNDWRREEPGGSVQ